MNAFRLYREIINNPSYPEQTGTVVFIQDYGDLDPKRWWKGDCLGTVMYDAKYCEDSYRGCGVHCKHWIAVYRGWTVEYVEVAEPNVDMSTMFALRPRKGDIMGPYFGYESAVTHAKRYIENYHKTDLYYVIPYSAPNFNPIHAVTEVRLEKE